MVKWLTGDEFMINKH